MNHQLLLAGVLVLSFPLSLAADDFTKRVEPFISTYCVECHGSKKANADLDLSQYTSTRQVVTGFRIWSHVIEFIRDGKMPPEDSRQPTLDERESVVAALEAMLLAEAAKQAGDPGVVLPRRLSNTEYDFSVRDLTGVHIRPTFDFPPDPAGGEGFDNTGEALSMSPSLLRKYLAAAGRVTDHLVLKTTGMTFAPHPVTSYNERKKLTEQSIIDFYADHEVRLESYVESAWRFRYRGSAERNTNAEMWGKQRGLSGRYLTLVFETLEKSSTDSMGYVKELGKLWKRLPPPSDGERPPQLGELTNYLEFCRKQLCRAEPQLIRSNAGNWPISHLDFRAQEAAQRDRFDPSQLVAKTLLRFDRVRKPKDGEPDKDSLRLRLRCDSPFEEAGNGMVIVQSPLFSKSGNLPRNDEDARRHEVVTLRSVLERHAPELAKKLAFGKHPRGGQISPDSFVIQSPAFVEIPLSANMLPQVHGKHLLAECELDAEHSRESAVHVQQATDRPLTDQPGPSTVLLMHPDSKLAAEFSAAAAPFCQAFPNRFYYVDNSRGLAAGFHLVEGFFRDDRPLVENVLDDKQRAELDALWQELHFVTGSAETLLRGFVWFERSERHVLHDPRFDFLRPEDPRLVQEELLTRFEREYLDKMGVKLREGTLEPLQPSNKYDMIHGFFEEIREGLALQASLLQQAEPLALADWQEFARRAYGRKLSPREWESFHALYQDLRGKGQSAEEALRAITAAILMSPEFCYRYTEVPEGAEDQLLSSRALARRLSYFLWSSLPDAELLTAAEQDRLVDESVVRTQTRRMLKDPKVSAFAAEFFGQWLRYRDFLSKDPIHAAAFKTYTEPLRQAMSEEPVRLATHLIQQDRPITELLDSDLTFVNAVLADHYGPAVASQYRDKMVQWERDRKERGVPVPPNPDEVWQAVTGLRDQGRGGLPGMAVILAKNSAGERTSPVKRGFWTVHHLLGKHFPPPPADVPELPPGEKQATKTIRELMTEHAAHAKCAICHTHFDAFGMAMEGFDPIGRARSTDLAGRPIDTVAVLPNGETAAGIPDLIDYIKDQRRDEFVRTLCRKFLGYALGRSVMLSDEPLLRDMQAQLEKHDYRFSILFETVVTSSQFRRQRGRDFVSMNVPRPDNAAN